ncbi:hypothetical protein BN85402030 [Alteracholeplasma palmae J233]|uniref:Uncharacterized protein n=1 Tax=Alteracholeplasma palmae (strain ATCC 49389 / J233) TaxID=1318466 RepID=U4KNK7_ALTPJ|nr:hypothetical protein [Alteracholeplasma palmae]CCV63780.1 hypothetical protein BN85402030 [Alteracholeplasma palmae J233]
MTKNELMYTYALDEYKNVVNRKNEIRNRDFTFYSFSVPIITALVTFIFSITTEYPCAKIILLIFSSLLFVVSLVIFLMIYVPSNQMSYKPKDIVNDLRNIESNESYKSYVELLLLNVDQKEEISEKLYNQLAQGFLAERYAEIIDEYEKKNLYFKKLFIILSTTIIATLVLLLISIII